MVDFGEPAAETAEAVAQRADAASDRSGAMLARALAIFIRVYGGDHSAIHRGGGGALPRGAAARGATR